MERKRKIWLEYAKYNAKYEKSVAKEMRVALVKASFSVTETLDANSINLRIIEEALINCYIRVGVDYKKVEDRRWKNTKGLFDEIKNSAWVNKLKTMAQGLGIGSRVAKIRESFSKSIQSTIDFLRNKGRSDEQIKKSIKSIIKDEIAPHRAKIISRTEVTRITNEALYQSALEQGGEMVKEWIPTLDSRTRDTHRAMASYPVIGIDEKFRVGSSLMMYAGDVEGGASEVINCRCITYYSKKGG